ncbi:MAG: phosphotransferase family protein [Actinobacteria bacterium]|nr:phosphotransferase family protein [Actinomycetota bacterium]
MSLQLDAVRGFLDSAGLGAGEVRAERIGDGHSNLTYRLERGDESFVVRRPPLGDLAASANDVLREARVVAALADTDIPTAPVLALCDDASVIGAPFYVMGYVAGEVITSKLPSAFDEPGAGEQIATTLIDTLARIHAVDLQHSGLASIGRPSGYLARQLRRFGAILDQTLTRPLPGIAEIGDWLSANLPETVETTLVHGDFRLGNLLFASPARVAAVLDWEMATVGDPLADLGYCTAFWAETGDEENPMLALGSVSRDAGFPSRQALADHYAEATGRSIDDLAWYQVLAIWKAAIFLEASYGRYRAGDSDDEFFADLDAGVPALVRDAQRAIERA